MEFLIGRLSQARHVVGGPRGVSWVLRQRGFPVGATNHSIHHLTPPSHHHPSSNSFGSVRNLSTKPVLRIPPNLKIDPSSSFAPVSRSELEREYPEKEEEQEEEEEEELDASAEEEEDEEEEEEEYEVDEKYLPPPEVTYAVPLPERLHVPVHTLFAPPYENEVGTLWLDECVFGCDPIRVDLLKRAAVYYRAKKRGRRKAKTKGIHEVSGSGRKLRPQKGQGRARVGHSRPPHFRGGAVAHGPSNLTDYGKTKLNKKVRHMAIRNALSQKLLEGNLIILNNLYELPTIKTNALAKHLNIFDIGGLRGGASALILDDYQPEKDEGLDHYGVPVNFWLASRNIPKLMVGSQFKAVVYHILKHEKLVLTVAAVEKLEQRLKVE
mmetsp:Transcript_11651/g.23892  ORF Transcript_11651/g.23892 Transcript_11651/m.23892 type:complete len:381 (-) Transcript_11651:195-1337(-)